MNSGGFGSRNLYESTAAICSGIAVFISIREKELPTFLGICGLAIFGTICPSIYRLYGFWVLLLSANVATRPLAIFPISCWCLAYFNLSYVWLIIAPIGITLSAYLLNQGKLTRLLGVLFLTLAAITAYELMAIQPKFRVSEKSTFSPGYKIGAALQRIFPDSFGEGSDIRSNLHGTEIPPSTPGIVIAEHDTPVEKRAGRIRAENFTQPSPWSENEFLGNQYWRYAIREDGCLVSNLGGQLTPNGQILLAIPSSNPFSPTILATKEAKTIYCADSDYWINRLCNYQQNLLGLILSSKQRSWPPLIVNIAFVLIALGSLWRPFITLISVFVPLVLLHAYANYGGDIRLIGKIFNPHDPARAWGVVRRLQDDGINAVFGNKGAKALVVEEGYSGKVVDEKLVIGEPRTTVLIGSHKVQILDEPQGVVDTIPDARKLLVDGKLSGVREVIDGVTIVGTGSPALTPLEIWSILREQ